MGRIKDKEKTLKLVKDSGETSNTLGNYTGVGTVTFYLNKKWKATEKYYGNIFQGKKHGYGEYNYQNGDFYQGLYEHGKKNGIGTYFYNMDDRQGKGKGNDAKGTDDESSEEEEENSGDEKGDNENSDDEKGNDEQDDEENEQRGKDADSEKETSEEEGENDQNGSDQSGEDQSEGDTEQSDQNEQDKEVIANKDGYQNSKKENKADDNEKNASKKLLHLMQKWNNTKMKKETIVPAKEKGSFYYGNYANGLKHNEGMMLYRNGDVYIGGWKFGKKSGWGRYTYKKCKSILEGHWEDGYLTHGKWILPNGMYFVGNFKNNKPSGDGVWAFADRTQLNVFYYEVKQKFKKSPKKEVEQGDPDILLNYKPLYITSTR
ncbi:Uncharacterized protein PCOAH_00022450 [Plasmodium coatneyi]|uniref:MORN repeat protein n=1 Tax=Plasmodium coatneyi TaxID=208452 RepID=A0A1B1DZE6_9APIC|nr:Uncharacterized protein PCOAH_00022450 [Plasmodium coatneyi]ANQ07975.1 Uncharacterized protein PCOAH_00022450 [Plasmodium coatneyi]